MATITEAKVVGTTDIGFTAYRILVTLDGDEKHEVVTRYSEIEQLVAVLKQQFKLNIPNLPRKHMWASKSSKVVEDRKAAINKILVVLVAEHLGNEEVMKFLDPVKAPPPAERLSRVAFVQAETVAAAFAGDNFEHTWPEPGPLGLSTTAHELGDGTIIAIVHGTNPPAPKECLGCMIETLNGSPVPTSSNAEILASIKYAGRPLTLGFKKTGEAEAPPLDWEDQKAMMEAAAKEKGKEWSDEFAEEEGAAEGEAPARERADTGTMDPKRLTEIMQDMDTNHDGTVDEAEFAAKLEEDDGSIKPQLLHYLKFKRWLKNEFKECFNKDREKLESCLDSEELLAYMAENDLPTDNIPEGVFVLQRVDEL